MSSVGKFFLVANLALAAVFVGAAATLVGSAGDWRTKYNELNTQFEERVKEKDTLISQLQAEKGQLESEVQRLASERSRLEGELQAALAALSTEKQKNTDLTESLNGINAKLGDLEQTNRAQATQLADAVRQMDQFRSERDQALDQRDAAVSASTTAVETSTLAEGRISELEAQVARLGEDKESAETRLLEASTYYGFDPKDFGIQPLDLEGVVLDAAYDGPGPIVVINIGKKHNVRPGYTFDVYGGSSYKGRIRVDVVNENNSAGTVTMPGNARIAAGDRVRTQL
ncbi:MAG: hypothetical protein EYC70_13580 [Planctomycetota bacterium]|nr:MAG: hypothetical protein EYC70_13580 [Planctomycetota bacterium]